MDLARTRLGRRGPGEDGGVEISRKWPWGGQDSPDSPGVASVPGRSSALSEASRVTSGRRVESQSQGHFRGVTGQVGVP